MTKKRSFTLVELLVVMLVSSVVMGVMAEVFVGTWRAQTNQEARTQLQQSSRLSLDTLTTAARQAESVVDSITLGGVTYTSGSGSVVLKLAALDATSTPTDLTDYIIFNVAGSTKLQRIISADPSSSRASQATPIDLTTELSSFNVTYYDPSANQLVPGTDSLATTASLRFTVAENRVVNSQTIGSQLDDLANLRNR